ncbi:type II toxin-antitoxin system RelE/ParE family toxin [Longimicrobium sp.]|uniref:type II toxin-antitoxin system RelE/ParE family toxin n=1 Tax=Longimicrobium sp. TaxID=2029185 RepID=UPI002E33116C|nr:type II toxin-antitoxin system RelE/ParE family toxin [Longimicrobium sp.]HEX6042309.1 type II toxin-antitoxin system RelE/ParE family toxin [Longimicrobium sp.]
MRYRFTKEARADVREAKAFIGKDDDKRKRDKFAAAVEHAIHSLLEYPYRGSPYELQTRRIMLLGFDYAMIYIPTNTEIQIVAVTHTSRDPRHWHHCITGEHSE